MEKKEIFRRVDKIEREKNVDTPVVSKIQLWEKTWLLCANILAEYNIPLKEYHLIVEKWIPLINKIFNSPIQRLDEYMPMFIYCDKINAPKEILSVYFDINTSDVGIPMYIIFNVHLFKKLLNTYMSLNLKNNQINFDIDRGTVNVADCNYTQMHPSDYFKHSSSLYLLFLAILHLMTHIESFEKYDTASYTDHNYSKKSCFYKLYLYGRIKHNITALI